MSNRTGVRWRLKLAITSVLLLTGVYFTGADKTMTALRGDRSEVVVQGIWPDGTNVHTLTWTFGVTWADAIQANSPFTSKSYAQPGALIIISVAAVGSAPEHEMGCRITIDGIEQDNGGRPKVSQKPGVSCQSRVPR